MDLKKPSNNDSKVNLSKETDNKVNLNKGNEEPKVNLNKETSHDKVVLEKEPVKEKSVEPKKTTPKPQPKVESKPKEEPKKEQPKPAPTPAPSKPSKSHSFSWDWEVFFRILIAICVFAGFAASLAFTIVVFQSADSMKKLAGDTLYGFAGAAGILLTIITAIVLISYIVKIFKEGLDYFTGGSIALGIIGLVFSIISIPSAVTVSNKYKDFSPEQNVFFTLTGKEDVNYTDTTLYFSVENKTGVDLDYVCGEFVFYKNDLKCYNTWNLYSEGIFKNNTTQKMIFDLSYKNVNELAGPLSEIKFQYRITELGMNFRRTTYDNSSFIWGTVSR